MAGRILGLAVYALVTVGMSACGGSQLSKPMGVNTTSAALPFHTLNGKSGRALETEDFYRQLSDANVVCIGESHDNPHDHWAQLTIVKELSSRWDGKAEFALAMEMFQRPFQPVLDDYSAGKIDETQMLVNSGWSQRWGFDWALY